MRALGQKRVSAHRVETPQPAPPSARSNDLRQRRRAPRLLRLYQPVSGRVYAAVAVATFALLLGAWWIAAELDLAQDLFLPSPVAVAERGWQLVESGELWTDIGSSFLRITVGFLISSAIAIPIGVLIGSYRGAEAAIEPPLGFIRYMPAVAFVPLTIIWVGVGEGQKYLIIFIGTFFAETLMVMDNVKRIPRDYVNLGHTLGLSDARILRRIVLPTAAPAIWDTLRINLGWAWTWLVLAELVAASSGLGYRIIVAQRYLQTDTIFFAIFVIGLLGLLMDQAMKFTGRRIFRWAEE